MKTKESTTIRRRRLGRAHSRGLRTPPGALIAVLCMTAAFTLGACDVAPEAETTNDADAVPAGQPAAGNEVGAEADAVIDETAPIVNPNEAGEAELRAVGLDSTAVAALVSGRPWPSMVEVDQALAARMDSTARVQLYRQMFIPIDLNSAPEDEILLIPGVGPRMAHEFEEYRPYRGIEQFRREIGKYVDEAEVARLERYVTIR